MNRPINRITVSNPITELDGVPIRRLHELTQAEKAGLLVVLPVPIGENKLVYGLTDPDDGPQKIESIECDYLDRLEIWPTGEVVVEVDGWEIGGSDIGKTVFLTEEEAEAALEQRKEGRDGDQ